MSALRIAINALAEEFASSVLKAIRTASLGDIAALGGGGGAPAKRGPGRPRAAEGAAAAAPSRGRGRGRRRRTTADLEALGARIVETVRGSANGLRAEAIRDTLGVARKELPRVLSQLISSGALKKTGQRRATTYFAGSGGAPRAGAAKAKRGGKKRAKKKAG